MRAAREVTCLLVLVGCGSGGTSPSGPEGNSGSSGTPGTCCTPLGGGSDAGTTSGNPFGGLGQGPGPGGPGSTTGPGGTGTPPPGASSEEAGTPASEDSGTTSDAAPPPPPSGMCPALAAITDYENAGPFMYTAKTSGAVKMWVPTVPAGCKDPDGSPGERYHRDVLRLSGRPQSPGLSRLPGVVLRGPEHGGGHPGHPGVRRGDIDVPRPGGHQDWLDGSLAGWASGVRRVATRGGQVRDKVHLRGARHGARERLRHAADRRDLAAELREDQSLPCSCSAGRRTCSCRRRGSVRPTAP